MTNSSDLDALFNRGIKTFKFNDIGDSVEGVVVSVKRTQQTDFTTGKLLEWDDGSPRMQFEYTLQTDLRESDNDDGQRRIFAKGLMDYAIVDAIRKGGGDKTTLIGGYLTVTYSGDGTPSKRGFNPPKEYVAEFEPSPTPQTISDDNDDDDDDYDGVDEDDLF